MIIVVLILQVGSLRERTLRSLVAELTLGARAAQPLRGVVQGEAGVGGRIPR